LSSRSPWRVTPPDRGAQRLRCGAARLTACRSSPDPGCGARRESRPGAFCCPDTASRSALRTRHPAPGPASRARTLHFAVGRINFAVGRITCAASGRGLSYDAVLGVTFVSRCNSGRGTGHDVRRGGTLSVSCWVILWLLHRLMVFSLSPCEHRFRPGNVLTRCPHPAPEPSGFPFRRVLPHSLSGHPVQRGQQ
jgi:hypothetical protein